MNSYEILSEIDEALGWIKPDDPMVTWIKSIADFGTAMLVDFQRLTTRPSNEVLEYRDRTILVRSTLAAREIKKMKRRVVFISLTELEEKFRRFESPRENISSAIRQFVSAFDDFSETYGPEETIYLTLCAKELLQRFDATRSVLGSIADSLRPASSSNATVSLYFEDPLAWEDIQQRVNAALAICGSVASLLLGDDPPRAVVTNIESGSLWFLLAMDEKVKDYVIKVLSGLSAFVYRNYTTEGKIQSLVDRVDVLRALDPIREQLKSSNLETSNFDKHVQRAAEKIADDAATLFGASESIDIQETKISIGKRPLLSLAPPVPPKLITDQSEPQLRGGE